MDDLISRQSAIDAIGEIHPLDYNAQAIAERIKELPSAQQERLTDDDFETIRIHLNAYKETLCNQRRWKEAEEYQRIIYRFMSFASAQQEIVRCKDCKYQKKVFHEDKRRKDGGYYIFGCELVDGYSPVCFDDEFCSRAERRTDE